MKNHEKTITVPEGGVLEAPKRTMFYMFWRLFKKNRTAVAGMLIFFVFFIVAVVGVVLTTGNQPILDPSLVRLQEKLRPPLSKPLYENLRPYEIPRMGIYILGTDELGRDVFARMLQGAWVSLTVGFVAVGISVIIGVILGGWAGYYGSHKITAGHVLGVLLILLGTVWLFTDQPVSGMILLLMGIFLTGFIGKIHDQGKKIRSGKGLLLFPVLSVDGLITGLIDIMLCFPSFFLILTVVALLPSSIYNIMIIIGLTSWMGAARFVRAEFLSLREMDFITASRALGVSDGRIIFLHMIPNAIAPVLVSATIGIASAILTEAGLSFLGFGVPPPYATWGNILSNGKNFLFDAPWLTFVPGIAILIVVLAFNLFGEGLRDALNPKLRERL
ncbi:MAG: ABC transporter permease [Desulfobacterales bacterium]|nr:ABC transporter permease [Desulfobacterales bacterium]